MKKKIDIYSQYYFPVANAASNRVEKYVKALKDDFDVKIVTGMPNYPTGVKSKKYKWKLLKKEFGDYGEKIVRTYEFATKNEGSLGRILNYVSFMFSSMIYGLFIRKPDVIIVTSPPLFTAIGVLVLNKIRGIPYILEIRDLWPDSVVALGYMKETSFSFKVFSWLEDKLYKNASKVIGVTKGICDSVEKKGFDKSKIFLQYNIAEEIINTGFDNPYDKYSDIIKGKKIALFAGNMNEAYDFKKGAQYIKNNSDLFYVFIGDGSQKESFIKDLEDSNNVLFLDRMQKGDVEKFIYFSDTIFVPLKNEEFYKGTFSVKAIEGIVNNKDVIFLGPDGELSEVLSDTKGNKEKFIFRKFKDNINGLIN